LVVCANSITSYDAFLRMTFIVDICFEATFPSIFVCNISFSTRE
jgi:hypothetical protein